MPDNVRRRNNAMLSRFLRDDVVGEVEQAADQRLVTFDRLGPQLVARIGRLLDHKAAFRPDWDDHRIFHRLRLHQAEDLGAEIFLAVGPANAAAGDLTGAHVHSFDSGTVDIDL